MRKLERKYDRELVVIGIHSAKFTTERTTEAIRQAVQRYDVGHPVINDRDHRVWQAYAVRAWPTLMFIDPEGRVIGRHEGEFPFAVLDRLIGQMLADFDARGLLDRRPLSFEMAAPEGAAGQLRFPGKVLADEASHRLFIADTGHHRVVAADLDGVVQRVIGNGRAGLEDGAAEAASFRHPQGLALVGEHLFVADTDNHALRRVDLPSGQVSTVAGNGEQAMAFHDGGAGREVSLNSPWDVAWHRGRLYIAMAGFHQVWAFDPDSGAIRPAIGGGREGLEDGRLAEAALAQPSGLTSDGQRLYVACSEASAIRWVDLGANWIGRLVGRGLFEFGDEDGTGPEEVLLQHPLGITAIGGVLFVADTYNHKLKRLHPATGQCRTVAGSGQPGRRDGPLATAQFSEPGGLSATGDRLFVADTNNHAVRVVDLQAGTVATLQLQGLDAHASPES